MTRSKEEFLDRTGGFRADESQQGFADRVREIGDLETELKAGRIPLNDIEKIQRRLCALNRPRK